MERLQRLDLPLLEQRPQLGEELGRPRDVVKGEEALLLLGGGVYECECVARVCMGAYVVAMCMDGWMDGRMCWGRGGGGCGVG